MMADHALSERRACGLSSLHRATKRYQSRRPDQVTLRQRLRSLAAEHPRYGYRRLYVLLRREGWSVNHKRIQRLYRQENLAVRRKRRKRIAGTQRQASLGSHSVRIRPTDNGWRLTQATQGPQGVTLQHRRAPSYEEVAHWWMDAVLSIAEAECLALRQDALRAAHRLCRGEAAMRPGSAALRQLIVEAEAAGQRYLEEGNGLMQACLAAERDLIAAQIQPKERLIPAWMSDILDAGKAAESTA